MSAPSQPAAPESATVALYRAALGPVNTAHYLDMFDRFDHAGRTSPVWNPAAGLLTLNWLLFRQLWGAALVYLACVQGAALLVLVVARRFLQWPPSVEWGVLLALLLLSIALPGAYGTALLHADTRRRMTRAVKAASTVREACATLEKQASTRRRLWVLVVLNLLLAGAAVAAYLVWRPVATSPAAVLNEVPESPAVPASNLALAAPGPASQAVADPPPPPSGPATPAAPAPAPEPPPVIVSPPVPPSPAAAEAAPPPEPMPAPISPPLPSPERATLVDRPSLPAPAPAKPASPPRPAPATAASAAPQAHGINVGLFADPANAEKAHARLVEAGFPAILQKVESASGERTRVRVGPFAGRAQAEEAAARIRAMGLDAVVFAP
ncbi:SPOR domain-containing protein [Hydrogenophaga laconesensis]|uniref:Outer membrane biosynthesis protein TonB n=1 Tax=Hydrogenophaga laconesensis TaxID=1805971 RepID=A0ABU1V745_9BURK|nr:SPOR domain-containing protein [Hydrogenophaga laconesensis]MDR7093286.1 outer membrane biosynthesis protein TonB [Hydrogenophaga laconesensis]